MGANYVEATMVGKLSVEEVREEFTALQEAYRYEYGHSGYTGTFAEANGIEFLNTVPFESAASAERFVEAQADKWGPALAVRYKNKESKERWYVGACCSE